MMSSHARPSMYQRAHSLATYQALAAFYSPRALLALLAPTKQSHDSRHFLFESICALLRASGIVEPFLFGSVPLHTYLPHGDIDIGFHLLTDDVDAQLTALQSIKSHLDKEAARALQNENPALPIHSVTLVSGAEVKLVKFNVEGISVDVSANTFSALATLCSLERIDRAIDEALDRTYVSVRSPHSLPHLLKRSILLIKSWCLYDSEILASNHSQLSTYAIEILIIYCLNHYHHMLHHTESDPFIVLSIFIHVFSQFNFEEWAVCVTGPVRIEELQHSNFAAQHLFALSSAAASLPPLLASSVPHSPAPLLSPVVFWDLFDKYFVRSSASRQFVTKHINIVDPLDLNNNLGRSVSFAALWKIRLALKQACVPLDSFLLSVPEIVTLMEHQMGEHVLELMSEIVQALDPDCIDFSSHSLSAQVDVHLSQQALNAMQHIPFEWQTRIRNAMSSYRSLFARSIARHSAKERPDVGLAALLQKARVLQQVATSVEPPQVSGVHKDSNTISASRETVTPPDILLQNAVNSLPTSRLPLFNTHSPSLSRDDSSINTMRSPSGNRALFISTISSSASTEHKASEGSFSPLQEPVSCPPGGSGEDTGFVQSQSQPLSPSSPDLSSVARLYTPNLSPSINPLSSSLHSLDFIFESVKRSRFNHLHGVGFEGADIVSNSMMYHPRHLERDRDHQPRLHRSAYSHHIVPRKRDFKNRRPINGHLINHPLIVPTASSLPSSPRNSLSVSEPMVMAATNHVTFTPAPCGHSSWASNSSLHGMPYPQCHPERRQYVSHSQHHHHQASPRSVDSSKMSSTLDFLTTNADVPHLAAKVSSFLGENDDDSLIHSAQNMAIQEKNCHWPQPPKGERERRKPRLLLNR